MSKSPVETYFDYVENVLGIKQILTDRLQANQMSADQISISILISVQGLNSYSDSETDLLYKMIAALKLTPKTYLVVDRSNRENYLPNYELSLVDEPVETNNQLIQTYSPRVLLKNAGLKKQAWTEMQKLLQKI